MLIILQISDQKCPLPMPPSKEVCNVPNCDGTQNTGSAPRLDARRQVRPNDHVDTFREGPILSLVSNVSDIEISSVQDNKYSFSAGGGWLHTEWSEVIMCLLLILKCPWETYERRLAFKKRLKIRLLLRSYYLPISGNLDSNGVLLLESVLML